MQIIGTGGKHSSRNPIRNRCITVHNRTDDLVMNLRMDHRFRDFQICTKPYAPTSRRDDIFIATPKQYTQVPSGTKRQWHMVNTFALKPRSPGKCVFTEVWLCTELNRSLSG